MVIKIKSPIVLLVVALLATACGIHQYKKPTTEVNNLYREQASTDTNSIALLAWKEIFKDVKLQALITEGLVQNPDLKIAVTRIQQAEANLQQSRASLFPTLNASGTATLNKLSDAQGGAFINNSRVYQIGLNSSWEADIWGKLNSTKKANYASFLQSQAYTKAVQTGLIANIANYYYTLIALDQQLAITNKTIQYWIKSVASMKSLKEAARVTGAAVVQSEANRYAAEVTLPEIKQRIRENENALSVLLGRSPGKIERDTLLATDALPEKLAIGIPAQLLSNRPDVLQAEYNYRYYFENVNAARAYFYPALTITASGGLSNIALQNFFSSGSIFGSVAGGLTQPIFNRRANKTRLEVAKAQQQEALINFQKSLLTAGQEVSDALAMYQTINEKTISRTQQIAFLQKSIEYTELLLKYGTANYVEVINAQQSYLAAQLNQVNDQLLKQQSYVKLYRSLGGGWR